MTAPLTSALRRTAAPLAVAGVALGAGPACTPPDRPPALDPGPVLEAQAAPGSSSGDAVERPPSPPDPLERYLRLPAPAGAVAARALDSLEAAVQDWRDASTRDEAAEAADRADRVLASLPTLGDWRPLVRAELLAKAGDTAGVRRALAEVHPETGFHERWGWRFLIEALEEAEDLESARRIAEETAAESASRITARLAWLRAGELALAAGDTAAALPPLRRVLRTGTDGSAARSAARILDRLDRPGHRDEEMDVTWALLSAGDWRRAHERLAPLLDDPEVPEVERARIRLGMGQALVELRRPSRARGVLSPLTGEAVPADLAAPALYWTGRAALQEGRQSDAEAAFRRLARRAPESPLAERALLVLLDREPDGPPTPRALELLDEIFGLESPGARGELAAVRIGTAKYLRGDYARAAVTFSRYLEASPRSSARQQGAYWAGLTRERQGDREEALALFRAAYEVNPLSFYGVLAGERLGESVIGREVGSGPGPVPGIADEVANALIRLRVHRLVPTSGSFATEVERLNGYFLERAGGLAAYDYAESLIRGGFPVQGIVLGREIHRREGEWNLRLLRIVHPFPYRETIVEEARQRGLDPFFVAGLIRQESMFDAQVRSPAGAVGLMQLMPATARQVARSAGIRYSPEALTDPRTNVRLGTRFLASLVNRFDGRAEDALAAYNAGPTRLTRWRRTPEYGDRDVFVEHIPFQETRNYVKRVQQYARIYTALYGCDDFQPCPGLSYPAVLARSPTAGGAPTTSAVAR